MRAFDDAEPMIAALADEVTARLDRATRDGEASFVAAGGTTPAPLYRALSRRPLRWEQMTVIPSDERWLPEGADGTNAKLLRDALLQDDAAAARLLSLRTDAAAPEDAETAVNARLAAAPWPPAVAVLGLGDDGHTASLFPGAQGLQRALDTSDPARARAVRPREAAGSPLRMSLTLRALLDAEWIALLLRGQDKRTALEAAGAGEDVAAMPVRALLHRAEVFWAP